jgi:hypothetical protein
MLYDDNACVLSGEGRIWAYLENTGMDSDQ